MADESEHTDAPAQETAVAVAPTKPDPPKIDPVPAVITTRVEYDNAYRYLTQHYHVLSPISSFSSIAPQHGLLVAKVLINPDPAAGEVYQDKLFCRTGSKDSLDDEVAIAKVGLRKLAIAAGWSLSAEVLRAERSYWMIRATSRFLGLDGAVQSFAATEEYDLRDDSPQVRGWSPKQKDAARAHGLRGGEARALNAACREFGIRQKYTRRELGKAFCAMRMMFLPDPNNADQMRIVVERALAGTQAMYPQAQPRAPLLLEDIDGMATPVGGSEAIDAEPQSDAAMVKIKDVKKIDIKRKAPAVGSFPKWTVITDQGEAFVTLDKDLAAAAEAAWKASRPVEITAGPVNQYREREIEEMIAR